MNVQVATRAGGMPSAARFRKWARAAAIRNAEVTVRLVGKAEAKRLNLAYRGKDYATNVLSFEYEPGSGDIVLCPSVIAREALEQGKSLERHYAHLTVHGVLHLRGYDHERAPEASRMERAEIRILKGLGHPNPYLA